MQIHCLSTAFVTSILTELERVYCGRTRSTSPTTTALSTLSPTTCATSTLQRPAAFNRVGDLLDCMQIPSKTNGKVPIFNKSFKLLNRNVPIFWKGNGCASFTTRTETIESGLTSTHRTLNVEWLLALGPGTAPPTFWRRLCSGAAPKHASPPSRRPRGRLQAPGTPLVQRTTTRGRTGPVARAHPPTTTTR